MRTTWQVPATLGTVTLAAGLTLIALDASRLLTATLCALGSVLGGAALRLYLGRGSILR
jgi:hypothetical protein